MLTLITSYIPIPTTVPLCLGSLHAPFTTLVSSCLTGSCVLATSEADTHLTEVRLKPQLSPGAMKLRKKSLNLSSQRGVTPLLLASQIQHLQNIPKGKQCSCR